MTSCLEKERVYSQRKRQVREVISEEKVKKKRISGEAYDINTQSIHRVGQKWGHRLMIIILSNLNRFKKNNWKIALSAICSQMD